MALITIQGFTLPAENLADGTYTLRTWYPQGYLDSTGQAIASGTSTTGTQIRSNVTVSGGFMSFASYSLYSTLDALTPNPQALQIQCQVFRGNTALPIKPFNQISTPASWILPSDLGATISFEEWTLANQRISLYYAQPNWYTAAQVDALIAAAISQAAINQDYIIGDYASFAAAITAVTITGGTLVINEATTTGTQIVPANVTLRFTRKGSITVNSATTLTVRGPIEADPVQIFFGAGTVSFSGNIGLGEIWSEWFGTVSTTTNSATAIQTALTAAGTAANKLTVKLQSTRYFCTSGFVPPSSVRLIGNGYESELYFENAGGIATGIGTSSATHVEIGNLRITGSSTPTLSRGIYIIGGSNIHIHDVWESGATFTPVSGPMCGIGGVGVDDFRVEDCDVSGNGTSPVLVSSYDILNNDNNTAQFRIHFNRNRVHDSSCNFSVIAFNVNDSEIKDNFVDQNNKIATTGTDITTSGYGVTIYTVSNVIVATGASVRNLISGNEIQNCAGFGIYAASMDYTTITNNILYDVVKQQTGGSLLLGAISINHGVSDASHVIVANNNINISGKSGIILANPRYAIVSANTIKAVVVDGIQLNSGNDCVISENAIESPGGAGINSVVPSTRMDISHNRITGAGAAGIGAESATDSQIDGNTVRLGATYGIIVTNAATSRTSITNNHLTANATSNVLFQEILAVGTNLIVEDNTITPVVATLTGATNTTPIVVATAVPHGLVTGQTNVTIAGVVGNTAANGTWTITVVDSTHFSLNTSVGNGAYVSGGSVTLPHATSALDTSSAVSSLIHHNIITGYTNGIVDGGTENIIESNRLAGNTTPISGSGTRVIRRYNTFATGAVSQGQATLGAGGTVTVATTEVRTGDNILLTNVSLGGTAGFLRVSAITDATSFVITSSNAADTSIIFWQIIH